MYITKVRMANRLMKIHKTYVLWGLIIFLSYFILFFTQENTFEYNRTLIEQGEYWRLLTGNLTHINYTHWEMNIAGLLFIAVFFGTYGNLMNWLFAVCFTGIFVSCGLYFFNTELMHYAGLSGILHGLFIYGLLHEIHHYSLSGYILSILLVGKLIWEQCCTSVLNTELLIGAHVVTEAHLYGGIGGLILYFIVTLKKEVLFKIISHDKT